MYLLHVFQSSPTGWSPILAPGLMFDTPALWHGIAFIKRFGYYALP